MLSIGLRLSLRGWLRRLLAGAGIASLLACTPQSALLMSALPGGTLSVLAANLQGVEDSNRRRVAELESNGDWAGLLRLAEENLALQRLNADWWVVAGYANLRLDRHAAAAECFGEVVRLEPDEPTGWHWLAQTYRAKKEPQRAVAVLERAQLALRDSPGTHFLLAESYADLSRHTEAAAAYRRALALEPRLAHAWYGLGRAELRSGRPAEAQRAAKALEPLDGRLAAELTREIGGRR